MKGGERSKINRDIVGAEDLEALAKARPIRVAISKSETTHERTGLAEVALISLIAEQLKKENSITLYDRLNCAAMLEEGILTLPADDKKKVKADAVDFLIRLRDYSTSVDNGVEVWLSRLAPEYDYMNLDTHWMVARVGSKEKDDDWPMKVCAPLIEKIKKLSRVKASASAPPRSLSPKTIVYKTLSPVEQKTQVGQHKALSETIMIGISNQLNGQKLISRDDWGSVLAERARITDSSDRIPDDSCGELLLSGSVWLDAGKNRFFFMASDLATGELSGTIVLSGEVEEVTDTIAKWCKGLCVLPQSSRQPIAFNDKILQMENDMCIKKIIPYGKAISEYKRKSTASANASSASSTMDVVNYARTKWESGEKRLAVEALEKEWEKSQHGYIAFNLQNYYTQSGQYAKLAALLEKLVARGDNSPEMMKQLNRARSLASNTSALASEQAEKRQSILEEESPLELKGEKGRFLNNYNNKNFEENYFIARTTREREWFPQGLMTNKMFYRFDTGLARDNVNDRAMCRYGVWEIAQEIPSLGKTMFHVRTWESFPLFSEDTEPFARWHFLDFARDIGMRTMCELAQHPNTKISNADFKEFLSGEKSFSGTVVDFLKTYLLRDLDESSAIKESVGLSEYLAIDIILSSHATTFGDYAGLMNACMKEDVDTVARALAKREAPKGTHKSLAMLAFKAYKGDAAALSYFSDPVWVNKVVYHEDGNEIVYLLCKAGREMAVISLLKGCKRGDCDLLDPLPLRWANPDLLKKIVIEQPLLFRYEEYTFLAEGFGLASSAKDIFYGELVRKGPHGGQCINEPICMLLSTLTGMTLTEMAIELEQQYVKGKKGSKQ